MTKYQLILPVWVHTHTYGSLPAIQFASEKWIYIFQVIASLHFVVAPQRMFAKKKSVTKSLMPQAGCIQCICVKRVGIGTYAGTSAYLRVSPLRAQRPESLHFAHMWSLCIKCKLSHKSAYWIELCCVIFHAKSITN